MLLKMLKALPRDFIPGKAFVHARKTYYFNSPSTVIAT